MVRRTKEEAQATRNRILDTAEVVFHRRGVSRTTLQEVAEAAGVTRGAIYWHFRDKAELFNAMMERVILPLEQQALHGPAPDDPLDALRRSFVDAMRKVVSDAQVRRVFEVASHKVEYVDELEAVRDRRLATRETWVAHSERALRQAMREGQVTLCVPARAAALGLYALVDGLIQNWMLDSEAFDLVKTGRQVLDAYLAGVSSAVAPGRAGARRTGEKV
jgi:TetR/AcrR family acrAB operon transcriptional repressor